MEHEGNWALGAPFGRETGGCCMNMTLRDYARVGLFAKHDGVLPSGQRILPEGWMKESTTPSPAYDGYGYQWWLYDDGAYSASGLFAQAIFIKPMRTLVIAVHSNGPAAAQPVSMADTSTSCCRPSGCITPSRKNGETGWSAPRFFSSCAPLCG